MNEPSWGGEIRAVARRSPARMTALLCVASLAACSGGVTETQLNPANSSAASTPYTIGVTVSGLSGGQLVLQNNGTNNLTVDANGTATFSAALVSGNPYNVSVLTQPGDPTQTCVPGANAIGTVASANVANITIACSVKTSPTDMIGGTVSGLVGSGLVLENNGGDKLTMSGNGRFNFATPLASGTPYAVTVLSPPLNPVQNCAVTAGSGTTGPSDVNNVAIACSTATGPAYAIGGTVSGLPAGASLVLEDNGRDDTTVSASGSFNFKIPISSGSSYNVSVASLSDISGSLSCSVQNGGGVVKASAITNVTIICNPTTGVTLVSLQVSTANASIAKGLSTQFIATAIYSNNSTATVTGQVTWSSSNPAVATITSAGVATALSIGATTITAVSNGISASATLSVTASTLKSITVGPPTPSLAKGVTQPFTATGTYTDNSTQNLTTQVVWASSNTGVATIAASGVATGVAIGSATISATSSGIVGSTVLTVTSSTLKSIAITPAASSVAKGLTQQFTAIGTYSDNSTQNVTAQVTWASINPGVATVGAGGLATATGIGTATISATSGAITGHATLTVTAATLKSILVGPPTPSLAKGLTQAFTATGTYTDGSTQNLTTQAVWASSKTGVATIAATGVATGVATGSASISATSNGIVGSTVLTVTPSALKSIAVTPPAPSIAKGLTQQFTAIGTYSDNSTQNLTSQVTWASSNTGVATIIAGGLATASALGTATISATSGTITGHATLTVTTAVLKSIAVTPPGPSIAKGVTQPFTATGTYTDNSTQNLTTQVVWASSNTGVATIAGSGVATGVATGTTTISATSNGIVGSTGLTVTAATLKSIAVTPPASSVAKGLTQQFTATGTFSDNSTQNLTAQVTWSSNNMGVATIVAGGLATSTGAGSALISATSNGITGAATLTVTAPTLKSIAVSPANANIDKGLTQQYTAIGTYTDNSTQNLTTQVAWNSSNASVATITGAGLATAVATGTTMISATSGTVSGSQTLTVAAAGLVSIAISPLTPSIAKGQTEQFTATGTYTDNTTQNLTASATWTSSNNTVATVSAGLATSLTSGSTLIQASVPGPSGPLTSSTTLTVGVPIVTSLALSPLAPTVVQGTPEQFTATATYSDNSTQNVSAQATWTSSNTGVATVSAGLASTLATGSTTISAAFGGHTANTLLTVTAGITVSAITSSLPQPLTNNLELQVTIGGTPGSPVSISQDDTNTALFAAVAGTAYSVSVVQEPGSAPVNGITSTICSIQDSNNGTMGSTVSDTVPSASLTLIVYCFSNPLGFAYVTDALNNDVAPYLIQSDGILVKFGESTATGKGPQAAAINAGYLYVADKAGNDLSVFGINPNTGELTKVIGSPFAVSVTSPQTITVGTYGADPALYVTNAVGGCSDTISAFDIAGGGNNIAGIGSQINAGPDVLGAVLATNTYDSTTYYYVINDATNYSCVGFTPHDATGVSDFTMNPNETGPALTFLVQTEDTDVNDALYSLASSHGYLYVGTYKSDINVYITQPNGILNSESSLSFYGLTANGTSIYALTALVYGGKSYLYATGDDGTDAPEIEAFYQSTGGGSVDTCYQPVEFECWTATLGSNPFNNEPTGIANLVSQGVGAYIYVTDPTNIYQLTASDDGTGNLAYPGASIPVISNSSANQTSIITVPR